MSNNIGKDFGANSVKWSRELAQKLDIKDGKQDGKIQASVWNEFLSTMKSKGNRIQNYITVDNAAKSFDYYNNTKDKGTVVWDMWEEKLESLTTTDKKEEIVVPKSEEIADEAPPKVIDGNEGKEPPSMERTKPTVGKYTEQEMGKDEVPDGIIDKSSQGKIGDCWLLTGLNALSETKWGREAIKEAIKVDPETGDIKITLKGAYGKNKVFTVSKQELETAKQSGNYSEGDTDVLAFELAIEKYRKQFGETLDGGQCEEVFRLVTGSNNTKFVSDNSEMKTVIQNAKAYPEKYALSCSIRLDSEYHAYNISRFEEKNGVKYVVLSNPWLSNREIRLTENEFMKKVVDIEVLANPTGKTYSHKNNADGKIGDTTGSVKDFDKNVAAGIYAVANKDPQLIKDCIKVNSNGSIKVTLKGVGQTYIISAKDLEKARDSKRYTQGDDDVLALELAMERYGQEQVWGDVGVDDSSIMGSGVITSGTEISGISDSRAIYLLTGKKGLYANLQNGKYELTQTPPSMRGSEKAFEKILGIDIG